MQGKRRTPPTKYTKRELFVLRISALSVGRLRPVIPQIMVFAHVLWDGAGARIQQHSPECEASDVFQHVGMLHGFGCRFSPCKRGMSGDQDARDGNWVETVCA